MTDRNLFEAIITLPSDDSTMLFESLKLIREYNTDVQLFSNEKGEVFYKANVNTLLENNITEEDITLLKNGSWKLSEDSIIKYM